MLEKSNGGDDPNSDLPSDVLQKAGCEKIFFNELSGGKAAVWQCGGDGGGRPGSSQPRP